MVKVVFFMSTDDSSAITDETIPVTAGFEISTGQPNMCEWGRQVIGKQN